MSEQDWKVQSALNTLKEADKINKDKKLMSRVSKLAAQEANSLSKLASKTSKENTMAKQCKPGMKPAAKQSKPAAKAPVKTAKSSGKKGK